MYFNPIKGVLVAEAAPSRHDRYWDKCNRVGQDCFALCPYYDMHNTAGATGVGAGVLNNT